MFSNPLSITKDVHDAEDIIVVPEAITFLLVLGYWIYINPRKDSQKKSGDGSKATPNSGPPSNHNWWKSLLKLFRGSENNTNQGDTVPDAKFSESPSAIESDILGLQKRRGSSRSHVKGKNKSEVSEVV